MSKILHSTLSKSLVYSKPTNTFRAYIKTLNTLIEYPTMGSNQSHIKANSRRYDYRSHSVYYLTQNETIVILRILGPGEDPLTQFNTDYENH